MNQPDPVAVDWVNRAQSLKLRVRNFIDGRWQEQNDESLEKYGPRDGQLLCRFGSGQTKEIEQAVVSARRSFEDGRWSQLPTQSRKDALHELATLIEKNHEELALLECLDVGKPIGDALTFDIPITAASIRHSAESIDHLYGKVYTAAPSNISYQLRRPLGVVAGIVGWNFPLVLAAQKIGPALATGNSLILKPSEFTSLATARMAELAIEAGVPEGVFNVIHGNGAVGAALGAHQEVDLVTFTGSTATGKKLLIGAGQSNMKRLVLECGGKAPNIVFDDAPNLEAVANAVVARAFWNQGQVCTASSRLLVQAPVRDQLLALVIRKVLALRCGDPLSLETKFGALVSGEHQQKVRSYVHQAQADGVLVAYEGSSPTPFADGFYVQPTIFADVQATHRIAQEEVFGPVLSVISFRDEAEAVRVANNTIYGLSAILWTKDLGRAHRMTQGINAGWISVNATDKPTGGPSLGVMSVGGHKQSGMGVEGGIEGLAAYTSQTAVQVFV